MVHEKPKSRIKNLSTRYLGYYKYGVAIIILCLVIAFVVSQIISHQKGEKVLWFVPFSYGYFVYFWWMVNKKVLHVEFDEDFMYVGQPNQDILIPLENIKDVNLISFGGVYQVDLYAKELFGDKFYFKPSLLYPFNHKRKEAVVDILWSNIEKAKKEETGFSAECIDALKTGP